MFDGRNSDVQKIVKSQSAKRRTKVLRNAIEILEGRVLLAYTLDPTFSGDGRVTGPAGSSVDMELQSDGKIVLGVEYSASDGLPPDYLLRYNADGSLDSSFGGGDGRVDLPSELAINAIQLSGNKILAAVNTAPDSTVKYVYRFNPDGSMDTSFGGGDGIAEVPGGLMSIWNIAVQGDGKIVVSGSDYSWFQSSHDPTTRFPEYNTLAAARLNADGSADTSFGNGGHVSVMSDAADNYPGALGIQPGTGNIVVGGTDSSSNIVVAWSPTGSFVFMTKWPSDPTSISALDFQPNGSIIVASTRPGTAPTGSLLRLTSTGQQDATFSSTTATNRSFDGVRVLPDGRFLVTGSVVEGQSLPQAMVMRFNSIGTVDNTFAPANGYQTVSWGASSIGNDVDSTPEGKVVIGGIGTNPGQPGNVGLARFANTSSATQSPFKGAPFNVGATIQTEDFDNGGEGVAYHDFDATNNGGAYRPAEAVDIEITSDTGGGFDVGWTIPGEWMEYSVNIPQSGTYTIDTRLASPKTGGSFHYELDGQNVSGPISIPNTGSFQSFRTITSNLGTLSAGNHTLRLVIDSSANPGGQANFNWMKINAGAGGGGGTGTGTGLKGEYFSNVDFTGPVFSRTDATVNYNWAGGSPDPRMDSDTFSVRWTGQIQAPTTGRYTFYTTTDDGVRLWVNNQLLIDHLTPQAAAEYSGSIDLVAGQKYDIRMDYFERSGMAQAKLSWSGPGIAKQVVPASQLYPAGFSTDTQAPSAVPNFRATDVGNEHITIEWDAATDNVGVAGYEVRIDMGGGWTALPADARSYTWRNLSSNYTHTAEIRAFDAAANRGPISTIHPRTTGSTVGTGLEGQYFNNMDFTALVFSRTNEVINYNWGTGSPGPGIDPDTFSVRWKGQILAPTTGRYTFYTTTDDGARLIINGQTIIDKMVPQSATEWSGTIDLVAGQYYSIQMDYFDRAGGAQAKLQWSGPGISKQVVPQSALFLH